MMFDINRRTAPVGAPALKTAVLLVALAALGACAENPPGNPMAGVEFREKRFEQMQKLQTFEVCRDNALQLDADARARGNVGAFLTSAQVIEKCDRDLGGAGDTVPREERMRLHALGVVNYFRGGDVEMARRRFDAFKATYPDHDLYLSGGASFVATIESLLGRTEPQTFGRFLALNVTDEVKSEMRRINHWKNK